MRFDKITRSIIATCLLAAPLLAATGAAATGGSETLPLITDSHTALLNSTTSATASRHLATLQTPDGLLPANTVSLTSNTLRLDFPDNSRAEFSVAPNKHSTLLRLTHLDLKSSESLLRFPRIPTPRASEF